LIGIAHFIDEDVNETDKGRSNMTCEVLDFQYERLLTQAILKANPPIYEEKIDPHLSSSQNLVQTGIILGK
jgi:hypothetical protein